jgi:triphosphoribosyl-dephospho-CoA synthase
MKSMYTPDSVVFAAQLACLLEVSAEKPGNVTPTHAFHNTSYEDFLRSAIAIGPEMGRAAMRGVGDTILAAITATRRHTRANTNLGMVLLFAPLAKAALMAPPLLGDTPLPDREGLGVGPASGLRTRLSHVLRHLTVEDARAAYAAIRFAAPGGLAEAVEAHDVHTDVPNITLREAMALAVERDAIAAEYLSDYAITFERGLPLLKAALDARCGERVAVTQTYLQLLAELPDTLIARKQGRTAAQAVSQQAAWVLAAGGALTEAGRRAMAGFDASLRVMDNQLNPGTTADLVAATLFVALLEGVL